MIKTKRWEIGFFLRKVVDGVVVQYSQFPRGAGNSTSSLERKSSKSEPQGDVQAETLALRSSSLPGPGTESDTQQENDAGPIKSSTSYEVGIFVRSSTETTSDAVPA